MALINVLDRQVDVDIRSELEEYEWSNANWESNKLIASSPFREKDRHPSFYIDFEGFYAGVWGDSAAEDDYLQSGTLPKLLAFLRDESFEESCEYILEKYDIEYSSGEIDLRMSTTVPQEERYRPISPETYERPLDDSYMRSRGIHPKVVEMMGVFDAGKTVGIPWKDAKGDVMAVKYRSKTNKAFFYEKGGQPLRELIYGLDIAVRRGITRAAIVESEIDAMTYMSAGVFAIAIGGARFNAKQADMVISSGLNEIILGGDNDAAGREFNRKVADLLENKVELFDINYEEFGRCKDANEMGASRLCSLTVTRRSEAVNMRIS